MTKPTLLFVEEVENTLSNKVTSNKTINVILLRFKQNMFFTDFYLGKTAHIPCFILDKEKRSRRLGGL